MTGKKHILFLFFILTAINGCSQKLLLEEEKKNVKNLLALYESSSWEEREKAVNRICAYKYPEATDMLIKALDDSHSAVRIDALKCLGSRKEKKAKRQIKAIAESENNISVKLAGIQALANYRDPTAAPLFAKGLESNDWFIREESIRGLLMINDTLIQQVSIPYILEALKDPKVNVRLAALENLKVKNKKLFDVLLEIIISKENYYKISLLKAALKALNGYLLNEKTRERVIEFLTHPNKEIRILSLFILKKDNELQAYE
ncbi:MAG: HEAT repeat domain-containing protein [Spirochaetes bacterium]|nr:HEAT repeat domain-containing protein [Spirochaetota bacterium]